MSEKAIDLNYRKANAAYSLLPSPSVLSSSGWSHLHLEVFQQPKFEIAEHQHTMHVIAHSPVSACFPTSSTGERWLDGKVCYETRHQGEIAIVPAGIAHRCNRSNQVWQIDHTKADILLVDEDGVEIGRPILTTVIDCYARCIVEYRLGLKAPSSLVVALALRHAMLPKHYGPEYQMRCK